MDFEEAVKIMEESARRDSALLEEAIELVGALQLLAGELPPSFNNKINCWKSQVIGIWRRSC